MPDPLHAPCTRADAHAAPGRPAGRVGALLVNTGSPAAPTPKAVRAYLARFLMDDRIVPMNRVGWWLILHLCILPTRPRASAEKYRRIWTPEGSPQVVDARDLARGVERAFAAAGKDVLVRSAMSYGDPTVDAAVAELRAAGCTRLAVLPLYPQSAFSTTLSVRDSVERALSRSSWDVPLAFVERYGDDAAYIRALAASVRAAGFGERDDDRLLFSYHAIPLADVEAGDTYELQVGATSLAVAGELGLTRSRWTIGYHSRFGKHREWLTPTTRAVLERWADAGGGRVFVVCPGFALDCLETLYDINCELKPHYIDRMRAAGRKVGADAFVYVPCLGSSSAHVEVIEGVLRASLEGE